jgi:type II secretory pathway component PulF
VRLPIPKGVERRLRPYMRRGEGFLRDWEWTWTTAFVAGIVISFFALLTLAVVPSWWLYFAEQELGWTSENRLLLTLRDIFAVGWLSVWAGFFVVTFFKLQVIRRRLRGEKQADRYSGGYR